MDDGSTDGSHELAAEFAAAHPWARALAAGRRAAAERDRLATAKELEAFQWAVEQLDVEWDVVGKLDADLRLTPRTIETISASSSATSGSGLAGSFLQEAGHRIRIGEGHVHGATKFFRRRCFEEISPVPPILGWDTIDEFTARMRGWRTQSFAMPDGDPEHLRPRGTHDGLLRGYRRWGECSYALGESPLHVALYTLQADGDRAAAGRGRRELRGRLRGRGAPARAARGAGRARLGPARAKAEAQGANPAHPLNRGQVPAACFLTRVRHTNVQAVQYATARAPDDCRHHFPWQVDTDVALWGLAAAAALLALVPAAPGVRRRQGRAFSSSRPRPRTKSVTFRVHGVNPRRVLRASLVRGGEVRRRISREPARRVARRGVLRVPVAGRTRRRTARILSHASAREAPCGCAASPAPR